jgi:hypothetical protein
MKKIIAITMVLAMGVTAASAGVVDDNTSYDRFFTGPWSNNFGSWRDDVTANGDNWLATNGGFVFKGAADGFDYVGTYVGSSGDYNDWSYAFTAGDAITEQDFRVKLVVNRSDGDYMRDLHMEVSVNGGSFVQVWDALGHTETYGDDGSSAKYTLASTSGFGQDGPANNYTADLSALGIQAGDDVVYKFQMQQNHPNGGNSKRIGLGVSLVPEPATMSLLALGGLGALIRRRRR